ncbi:hypothetical protein M427DRAFT_57025 [Gonapodya prolifera JEL478]|uniref:PWWP domain-containing protein n=1 Tax=Gonapodya prolifera (strain JEL478) TaxID=1344416 RepID=A0A139AED1_GONPJ|nr:hypothetical protein M427DRAFT_57025 [Gonapodya prolifera JEL478]|eukprot:KXS15151.1 hypothetical protein M427DRAFT_57025 [Gonapodya prolifera JEL478]
MSDEAASPKAPEQVETPSEPANADGSPEPAQSKSQRSEWKPDQLVWGHYKGFPWWPCLVAREDEINDEVMKLRKPGTTCCMFLGSYDFWWFTDSNIRDYQQYREEFGVNRKKSSGGKKWELAYELAENPEKLRKTMEARRLEYQVEWERKSKRREKLARSSEKRKKRDDTEDEDEEDGDESGEDRKKRKKRAKESEESESEEDEEEKKKRKEAKKVRKEEKERRKAEKQKQKEKEGEKENVDDRHNGDKAGGGVMKLRMKLQKYLMPDNNGPGIEDEHIAKKASDVLKEVETAAIDLAALKETKLGKVVKKMATKSLPSDPYKLVERCEALLDKWRKIDVGADKDDGKEGGATSKDAPVKDSSMEGVEVTTPKDSVGESAVMDGVDKPNDVAAPTTGSE